MSKSQPTPPDIPTRVDPPADSTGRITLPGYKEHKGLSEETTAFDTSIALDGVKVGTASNTGQGGPNRYHFTSKDAETTVTEIVGAWAKARGETFEVMDAFIGYLAAGIAAKKVAKRLFKKYDGKLPNVVGVLVAEKSPIYGYGEDTTKVFGYGEQEFYILRALGDAEVLARAKQAGAWQYFVYAAADLR